MSFEYNYGFDEGAVVGLVVYLLTFLLSGGMSIVAYVLRSLGVYTIAKRRELNHPWMAWVPVLDYWLLGSISDQYQYVAKGKTKNKRKWLIGLSIAMAVVYIAFWIVYIMMFASMFSSLAGNVSEMEMLNGILGPVIAMLVLLLPMLGISIALMIIRYMAMYDLYNSVDPKNSVMYLVLSVLISVTEPFFIFFNRKKDLGMPPRKDRTGYIPQEPAYAPHQNAYAVQPEPVMEAEPVAEAAPVTAEEAPAAEPVTEEPAAEPEIPVAEETPVVKSEEPIILGAAPEVEVPAGEPGMEADASAAEEAPEASPEEPDPAADPWDLE